MSRAAVVPFNVPSATVAPLFFVSVEDPKRLAEEAQARIYRAQALADVLGKVSECDSATALPAFARVMAGMLAEVEQLLELAGSAGARRDHGSACGCLDASATASARTTSPAHPVAPESDPQAETAQDRYVRITADLRARPYEALGRLAELAEVSHGAPSVEATPH